jgi:chromate transporter
MLRRVPQVWRTADEDQHPDHHNVASRLPCRHFADRILAHMSAEAPRVSLRDVLAHWGRIGVIGFGGPPAHISLLRRLCVEDKRWISAREFEDSIAACNLLPGPASTQLAIHSAYRVGGIPAAIVGGLAFIIPGFCAIVALAALFLAKSPPDVVLALGAGAGSAVAAVAVGAGFSLARPGWSNSQTRWRWSVFLGLGGVAAATTGPYVVVILLVCGFVEVAWMRSAHLSPNFAAFALTSAVGVGGMSALSWLAFKVGALSYGGGFVIIPLIQNDAVAVNGWMTDGQFLNAVALGQVTPGPVVLTVAVVGFAASGIGGAALASVVAFGPSFLFVMLGGRHFDAIRSNPTMRAFLGGAGPAAIGAILGSAIPLAVALEHVWQFVVLGLATMWVVVLRRGVVVVLLGSALVGVGVLVFGGPIT